MPPRLRLESFDVPHAVAAQAAHAAAAIAAITGLLVAMDEVTKQLGSAAQLLAVPVVTGNQRALLGDGATVEALDELRGPLADLLLAADQRRSGCPASVEPEPTPEPPALCPVPADASGLAARALADQTRWARRVMRGAGTT